MATATTDKLIKQLRDAHRVGTPLVKLTTADPAATTQTIRKALDTEVAILKWDAMEGVTAVNDAGKKAIKALPNPNMMLDLSVVFGAAQNLGDDTMLLVLNAQRFLDSNLPPTAERAATMQALWNLRDKFKLNGRMIVLLTVGMNLPPELAHDVVSFEEPYPGADKLAEIVRAQFNNAGLTAPEQLVVDRAVEALLGLSTFPAEDAVARNLRKSGLDVAGVWERKIEMVNDQKGMRIHFDPSDTFANVGGLKNAERFFTALNGGKLRPRVYVLFDEVEKQGITHSGDQRDPGTTQLGQMLSWMDGVGVKKKPGILLVGVQGSGKTLIARVAAAAAGVPLVILNLSEMRGEYQGNTERDTRIALKIVDALGDGNVCVIGTCNRVEALPPEFLSRFTLGTFFVDLPDAEERKAIWSIYQKQYELPAQELPADEMWSGREIAACAYKAWAFNQPIVEAAKTVNPVALSMGERLTRLRQHAEDSGFISASYEGPYKVKQETATATGGQRRLRAAD